MTTSQKTILALKAISLSHKIAKRLLAEYRSMNADYAGNNVSILGDIARAEAKLDGYSWSLTHMASVVESLSGAKLPESSGTADRVEKIIAAIEQLATNQK